MCAVLFVQLGDLDGTAALLVSVLVGIRPAAARVREVK